MSLPTKDTISSKLFDFLKDFLKTRASIDFENPTTLPTILKNAKKFTIMFLFFLISGAIIYYISTDENALSTKLYYYLIITLVPIVIFIVLTKDLFLQNDTTSSASSYTTLLKSAGYLLLLFAVLYLMNIVINAPNLLVFMNYFINIMLILIVLTGLAIIYFIFSNYIKQQTGAVGLFSRILFYLPCLFADFVNYIKKELSITPSVAYILFIMEIVFVLLYIYLPLWVNKLAKINSNVLLNEPVDLNIEKTIAGSKYFLATDKLEELDETGDISFLQKIKKWTNPDKLTENELYKHTSTYRDNNYSISFWVYVNAGTMSDGAYVRESNILNYANGKPKISYVNNGTHKGHKYVIYLSNSPTAEPYEIILKDGNQKWNYFAIVYHDNSADVFVNGKLLRTQTFNSTNLPLRGDESDTIVVGSDNGLKGAICNVSYYPYIIKEREIANTYNVLRFKNPPILGF